MTDLKKFIIIIDWALFLVIVCKLGILPLWFCVVAAYAGAGWIFNLKK